MKIAYITTKNIKKIISKMTKKGHIVFVYSSLWHILFKNFDIVHLESSQLSLLFLLTKIFKRKTIFIVKKIPQGIDISRTEKMEYLKKWNLQKSGYLLYVGKLAKHKAVHNLIEVYKNLEDQHLIREKKLVIVGYGTNNDYVNELKDMSRSRENIIFTGKQTGEALEQLFSHSYLFIQPTESENSSQALLDAIGYGNAILASDTKENLKMLKREIGLSFHSGDLKDLENKLVMLINNPLAVMEMGERAKEKAEKKYSWNHISKELENLYHNALIQKRDKLIFIPKTYERNV